MYSIIHFFFGLVFLWSNVSFCLSLYLWLFPSLSIRYSYIPISLCRSPSFIHFLPTSLSPVLSHYYRSLHPSVFPPFLPQRSHAALVIFSLLKLILFQEHALFIFVHVEGSVTSDCSCWDETLHSCPKPSFVHSGLCRSLSHSLSVRHAKVSLSFLRLREKDVGAART